MVYLGAMVSDLGVMFMVTTPHIFMDRSHTIESIRRMVYVVVFLFLHSRCLIIYRLHGVRSGPSFDRKNSTGT